MTNTILKNAAPGIITAAADISSGEFFRRAHERLNFDVPPGLTDANVLAPTGDFGTDAMLQIIAKERPVRPAAVLIPIVEREAPTVLLTKRAEHLNEHAGQISFPGGKIDPEDPTPMDAALREADEEIGLKRPFIDPIGYLDVYATGFGFRILPTLARVQPGFDLAISRNEVDDVFEVPLAFLMDPVNHKLGSKEFRGMQRSFYEMPFEQHYIWGDRRHAARALRADLSFMIRPVLTEIGIFLIPFAVYAVFLLASRSDVWVRSSWPLHIVGKLAVAAFVLVIVSLILLAHFSGAPPGSTYTPARVENGKLIRGSEK